MNEKRKLAAILAADVVGYSRLAGADTLARLRALRSDLIDPTIAVHHGCIVKRTGDGSLVEFRSVVDAVRCAIEVQTGLAERNAGLPPERRIEFRVGIHLGDVVEESDGDLMGDGVNIAARLQSICQPGAICLSEDAYRQVKGRLDLAVRISARINSRTSPTLSGSIRFKSASPANEVYGGRRNDGPKSSGGSCHASKRCFGASVVLHKLSELYSCPMRRSWNSPATLCRKTSRPAVPETGWQREWERQRPKKRMLL